jgi:hypothetical protein
MAAFQFTTTRSLESAVGQADHGLEGVAVSWVKTLVEVEMKDMVEERVAAE